MVRLSFFRLYARTIALFLLLTGVAGLQHSGKDDFACGLDRSSSDAATLEASPSVAAEHCVVCHWTRSLRSSSAVTPPIHVVPAAAADVDLRESIVRPGPSLDRAPARAPPLSV